MATYTEVKAKLDEIANRSTSNLGRLNNAKINLQALDADLTDMVAAYSAIIGEIDTFVTANPGNALWAGAKEEKDALVADFLAIQTKVQGLLTAIDA